MCSLSVQYIVVKLFTTEMLMFTQGFYSIADNSADHFLFFHYLK